MFLIFRLTMADNSTDVQGLTTTKIAFSVSLLAIAVINFSGNSIVIHIIVSSKLTKSPMNCLLLNLALADIILGVFLPARFIFTYFVSHPEGTTGAVFCKLFTGGPIAWIAGVASIIFLVAISFERYCAVVRPFSRKMALNRHKVKYIIVIAWVFGLVFNSPLFVLLNFDKKKNFCSEIWPEGYPWLPLGYTILWFIIGVLLPASIMISLYSIVIFRLWIKPTTCKIQFSPFGVMKLRKKATKMVVIVSVVYLVCWTPNLTLYFLSYCGLKYDFSDHHYIIGNILITCNSAINPFIYCLQSQNFREHLKKLFCKNRVYPIRNPSTPPRKDSRGAFTLDFNNL